LVGSSPYELEPGNRRVERDRRKNSFSKRKSKRGDALSQYQTTASKAIQNSCGRFHPRAEEAIQDAFDALLSFLERLSISTGDFDQDEPITVNDARLMLTCLLPLCLAAASRLEELGISSCELENDGVINRLPGGQVNRSLINLRLGCGNDMSRSGEQA
jgi:hypothetical protein